MMAHAESVISLFCQISAMGERFDASVALVQLFYCMGKGVRLKVTNCSSLNLSSHRAKISDLTLEVSSLVRATLFTEYLEERLFT